MKHYLSWIMTSADKLKIWLLLAFIGGWALMLRVYPLTVNHPFWVDEFSSAMQSNRLLENGWSVFTDDTFVFEHQNIVPHFLIALSFNFWEQSEAAARLPFAIVGAFLPIIWFLLVRRQMAFENAISTAILITTSYFNVVWSIQARSYVIQQVLTALILFVYLDNTRLKGRWKLLVMSMLGILAFLNHKMSIFLFVAVAIHFAFANLKTFGRAWTLIKKNVILILLVLCVALVLALITESFSNILATIKLGFLGLHNNFWYYHSFLWRNYSLIIFLAIVGWFFSWKLDKNINLIITAHIVLHLFFITFLFGHYISKYVSPIWPEILFLAGCGLAQIVTMINKNLKLISPNKNWIFGFASLLIVINGHNFVYKPQKYYSVNHDMREIAVINYDSVYDIISQQAKTDSQVAVLDTWLDRPRWYLGAQYPSQYLFRWENEGFHKQTTVEISDDGKKYIPQTGTRIGFVGNLAELMQVISEHPKGYLFVDDVTLPADVLDYAEQHFKKEITIDSYEPELAENPYSRWPAVLYSWGMP